MGSRMKRIVHYRPSLDDVIVEGQPAILAKGCIDHPSPFVSNKEKPIMTSKVIRIHEGYFETENNYYDPLDK
jgi:hypothetical protein